jgi:hypothetical protein
MDRHLTSTCVRRVWLTKSQPERMAHARGCLFLQQANSSRLASAHTPATPKVSSLPNSVLNAVLSGLPCTASTMSVES